jgi:hypothetical protein
MGGIMKKKMKKPYGQRTIKAVVYFLTDSLPSKVGDKTAWEWGWIVLPKNRARNIEYDKIIFNRSEEFLQKFQELLSRNDIKLVARPENLTEKALI